jgi:ParB-like chromosome segregation protein Spo0J
MDRNPVTEKLPIDGIIVSNRHRTVDIDAAKALAASMEQIGLRTPITIRSPNDSECYLVAGLHRLEAAKLLGWDEIECFVLNCSEDEAEMWEISENLHRAELTTLQRSEQVARWVELADKPLQVATVSKGGRGHESGVRKAGRDLNLESTEVHRAVKIASLTPEAKAVAAERGLDNNQSALLAAAKVEPSKQVEYLRERPVRPPSNYPQDDTERSIKWRRAFERVWNDAPSLADREWAMNWIDRPIMDGAA